MTAPIDIRILGNGDDAVLSEVAEGVFDGAIDRDQAAAFLHDSHHHLAVALAFGVVVGFASAIHYLHPDKPPELWVNEIGLSPAHRRRGLGTQLLRMLFDRARCLGCRGAWVLTDSENVGAQRLYESLGGKRATQAVMFGFELP